MALTNEELSSLVEKYPPIVRYTVGENQTHLLFFLDNSKEIEILINDDKKFEVMGRLRNINQRGFSEANCIVSGITEFDAVSKALDSLLGFNVKRQNK